MTSTVDICNMALSHVRGGSINSMEEQSTQATQCRLHYPILLDQMLQDSPWQFAGSIKPLSLLIEEIYGWAYVYQYPVDCLRINRIIPESALPNGQSTGAIYYNSPDQLAPSIAEIPSVPYKVFLSGGNRVVVANFPNLRIDYRVRIDNPALFSTNFVLALSHLLASSIAIPIVGVEKGSGLRRDSLQMYKRYLDAGIVNELNEQQHNIPDSDYITVRN